MFGVQEMEIQRRVEEENFRLDGEQDRLQEVPPAISRLGRVVFDSLSVIRCRSCWSKAYATTGMG